ncbi:MAG: peptide chain release factor N(5)-glutamine methyltransferase [Pseudomonadota bacterium]
MTVAEALRAAAQRLSATSDTARLDAEVLMAHALAMSRSDVLLRAMQDSSPLEFEALVDRRAQQEPVAYIVGEQEFFGLPFAVSQGVLIPRGDSEVVVEAALDAVPSPQRVLDLGTGSGALLLALLESHQAADGVGIDASQAALEVAQANARTFGDSMRVRFLRRDWLEQGWADDLGTFDLVVCNPPYVEEDAALDRDVLEFEPASALFAGRDGLDDYRILIPQLSGLLEKEGIAIFEIGATQALAVTELAEKQGFTVDLRHDLANRPRALILSKGNRA